jgi:hypothetical protein
MIENVRNPKSLHRAWASFADFWARAAAISASISSMFIAALPFLADCKRMALTMRIVSAWRVAVT